MTTKGTIVIGRAMANVGAGVVSGVLNSAAFVGLPTKGLHRWLPEYIRTAHRRKAWNPDEPIEVLLCVCDHYEPFRGGASKRKARERVQEWVDKYPKLFDRFRDNEGKPPQHTFFYPEDEYDGDPELLDLLADGLMRKGFGDVEIHLHHDNDTAAGLREKLIRFKETLFHRHGLLRKDETGEIVYAFIHGNWCLDNSRFDGRRCGVNNELDVLRETGCYADFTMPSAPDETQTRMINSVYWAVDDPARPKSHNYGVRVGEGPKPDKALLMVQGPLVLDWSARKYGVLPTIENGNLQKSQPATTKRLDQWLRAGVHLPGSENRILVKLHTHGVWEPNQDVLLGQEMVQLHEALRTRQQNVRFRYVTAKEVADAIVLDSPTLNFSTV